MGAAGAVVEVVVAAEGEAADSVLGVEEVAAGTDQVVVPARVVAIREGGGQSAVLRPTDGLPLGHLDRALLARRHRIDRPHLVLGQVVGEGTWVSEIVRPFNPEPVRESELGVVQLEIVRRHCLATGQGQGSAPDKELALARESPIDRVVDRVLPIVPAPDKALAIGRGFLNSRRGDCRD